ncbi:MAG: filamentous hemagglutinin N-terminal domain-containing protein [Phycisphaeraceae bacterium]|nr:filamentous hemagglutinin N-terminal domain-containing protein [Phycisphaeraceae bacterium]
MSYPRASSMNVRAASLAALVIAGVACQAHADRRRGGVGDGAQTIPGVQVRDIGRGTALFDAAGNVLSITVGEKTIINYDSFNIAEGSTVNFIQPGAHSRVLNRIDSATPTFIDGTINANGHVYLVNPSGVLFGQTSVVNAAGFVAAAGRISDSDFRRGVDRFTDIGAGVSNLGHINTTSDAQFVGGNVTNYGSVISEHGVVTMSAGENVYLAEQGDQIMVRIENPTASTIDGVTGRTTSTATIVNSGTISGDSVVFTTGDIYSVAMVDRGGAAVSGSRITVGGDVTTRTGDISIAARDVRISGQAGYFNDQDVAEVGTGLITEALHDGAEVTIRANGVDSVNGSIDLASGLDYTGVGGGTLNLIANNNVDVRDRVVGGAGDSLNLSLIADADANQTGGVNINAPISLGGGDLTVRGANVAIRHDITTTGTVAFAASHPGASIGLGDGAGSFNLKQNEINHIADGAKAIIIGDENTNGRVTVSNATFRDPVVINTPGSAGKVRLEGALRGVDEASITINGSGHTTHLGADLTTEGAPIIINDSVVINAGAGLVTIATTDNGNAGADITITGTVNNAAADPAFDSLNIDAGAGDVDLQGAVGATSRVFNLTVTGDRISVTDVAAAQTQIYNGDLVINGVMLSVTDIDGAQITINGDTVLANDVVINAFHDAVFNGKVDSEAGQGRDLTVNAFRTLFNDRVGGASPLGTLTTDAKHSLYDANGDGVLNDRDRVIVLDNFLTSDAAADLNHDGVVDTADLGITISERQVTMLNADVDAQTIVFGDPVEVFADNVTVTATGSVDFQDTVNSQVYENNGLDVIAPNTRFGGVVGRAETLTHLTTDAQPGATSIDTTDIYVLGGGASFGDDVTIDTTTTIHAADMGDVTFSERVNGPEGLTVETAGVTTFGGAVGDDTPLAHIVTDAPGLTRLNGPVVNTSGDQTYNDAVRVDGNTAVTAANASFNSTVDSQAGEHNDLVVNADQTLFASNVGSGQALGSLVTDGQGTTHLHGDVTSHGDRVQFGDDLVLYGDTNITNTGASGVFFHKTINSDSAATPRSLNVVVDNTAVGNDIPTINFGGNVGMTNALGDLILGGGRTDVPVVATIVARERGSDGLPTGNPLFSITFRIAGDFNMGQNEKLTTVGSLNIDAGGTAYLGDLSVRNSASVTAPTILLRAREAGEVLLPNGDLMADEGMEIIAGDVINFSVTPGVLNGANPEPIFSTPGLNFSNTLNGFEHVKFATAISNLNLFLAQPGTDIVLDLSVVSPMIPNDTNETARQDPGLRPFEDFVNPLHPESAALNAAGVPASGPALAQMLARTLGTTLYNDFSGSTPASEGAYAGRINTQRLPWNSASELLAAYATIAGAKNENLALTRAKLGESYQSLASAPKAEIETALVPGCLAYLRTGEETDAMTDLRTLALILSAIDEMGMTKFERAVVRSNILGRCRPEGVAANRFESLVEGYRAAIVEAEKKHEEEMQRQGGSAPEQPAAE